MNKYLTRLLVPSVAFLLPAVTFAQNLGNIEGIVEGLRNVVNTLIPIAAALALLAFFYGLAKYIFQADDEEAQDRGKRIMIGGIIALFLIAAIGGIIQFIGEALGIDTDGTNIDPTGIDTGDN